MHHSGKELLADLELCGVIVRRIEDSTLLWLAIPHVGKLLTSIARGRHEVLQLIARRKFKDVKLDDLNKRKLRSSILSAQFHVRDLAGRGEVTMLASAIGPVVRLVK